jgi:hypothetical protein
LFNAVTTAVCGLQTAQCNAENAYIESEDTALTAVPAPDNERPKETDEKQTGDGRLQNARRSP